MSRESLLQAFQRFRDALFACDTETLDALLTDNYRGYNLRGEPEDRNVVLKVYRPGAAQLTDFEVEELRVEVFSEVGIVTGRGYVAGSWQGHPWSHHLRFCDVYVLREGDWLLLLSHATPMEEPTPGP
jgi:ketosteroid isomerase-like protein